MLLLAVLALALAFLSWRFVEAPFRTRGLMSRARVFRFAAVGSAVFVSLGLARYYVDRDKHLSYLKRVNVGLGPSCETEGAFVLRHECATSTAPRLLIWGDSFAMHLIPGMVAADSAFGLAG